MRQFLCESQPLSVLALSPTSLVSGAERVLIGYAQAGVARGERWSLACPAGPLVELIEQSGISWLETPELRLAGDSKALAVIGLARRNMAMARLVRRHAPRFEVILANSVMSLPALVLARVDPPVCWLVHDVITRRDLELIARFGARAVTLAVGVSNVSAHLPASLGIRSTVVRNGVAWPVPPAEPADGPPILGINAVLTEWKGHRVFLEALSRIDLPFSAEILGGTFPGDVAYEAELRNTVDALGLHDRVHFLGHSEDPFEVMRRWSIAVSASIEPEAGPLSVMEAMSLGVPVVVSDHGGAPEVSGEAGLAVAPGDPEALASALESLLIDPDRRHKLGSLGRQMVASDYSIVQARAQFASVISNLARR
jgi:glycosyltransferase involved in cell wall biosynthesis